VDDIGDGHVGISKTFKEIYEKYSIEGINE
jgi:hypothetical protein